MIKSFEQFNGVCEGAQIIRKNPSVKYNDFTDLYCSLDYDCAMHCLDLVRSNNGEVIFEKPIDLTIYGEMFYGKGERFKDIKVSKVFVGQQNPKNWRDGVCDTYYNHKSGEYLMLQTTDNKEIPVDAGILDGHHLLKLCIYLDEIFSD